MNLHLLEEKLLIFLFLVLAVAEQTVAVVVQEVAEVTAQVLVSVIHAK